MLSLSRVSLNYGATFVLRDIELQIAAGQVFVVLGPNGAGKSSLLKVASGELAPASGEARLNDIALQSMPLAAKARHMAVLPQQSLLTFEYTVQEVVLLGRTPHATGLATDLGIVAAALERVDATCLAQRVYTHLSGGEKQRVQLARVLAQVWQAEDAAARALILDEPTAALDYAHQSRVAQLLRERADAGCAVLTAMHDINLAASCADVRVLLQGGAIKSIGSPAEVLQGPLLKDVFGVSFYRIDHPQTGRPWLIG